MVVPLGPVPLCLVPLYLWLYPHVLYLCTHGCTLMSCTLVPMVVPLCLVRLYPWLYPYPGFTLILTDVLY